MLARIRSSSRAKVTLRLATNISVASHARPSPVRVLASRRIQRDDLKFRGGAGPPGPLMPAAAGASGDSDSDRSTSCDVSHGFALGPWHVQLEVSSFCVGLKDRRRGY
jgi:hypothetical protein